MNATLTNPAPLAPVARHERVDEMDVLRGFALLGILLMNIEAFVGPLLTALTGLDPALTGADKGVDWLIYVLVQGKFMTLFSLLFGMGFAVMLERARERGSSGNGLYLRRLFVLLGFGLVHALLIWSGDILVPYALIGFVLWLFFRNTPVSRLPKWGVAFLLLLVIFMLLAGGAMQMAALHAPEAMQAQASEMAALLEGQRLAYGSGSYADAVAQRGRDLGFMMTGLFFFGPMVLAMFLFGAWFWRSGAIREVSAHLPLYRRLLWVGALVGLPLMLLSASVHPTHDVASGDVASMFWQAVATVAGVLMCLGYASAIVLLMQRPPWRERLLWLAPVGRMALTNYLLQSILCTLIFYGYGLGYFEQLPRAWQPLFVLAVFIAQVLLSHWWLARFRFGPAEWLWRALTYGRMPPMRLVAG